MHLAPTHLAVRNALLSPTNALVDQGVHASSVLQVRALLGGKADPNSITALPVLATALQHACSLHAPADAGERRAAIVLALINAGAHVNAVAPPIGGKPSSGVTALHCAAAAGAADIVRLLLEARRRHGPPRCMHSPN